MPIPIEFVGAGAMEVVWEDTSILRLCYEGIDGEPGLLSLEKAHLRILYAEFQGLDPGVQRYLQNAKHGPIWSPLNKLLNSTVLVPLAWSWEDFVW
jgi:hypothetical protein